MRRRNFILGAAGAAGAFAWPGALSAIAQTPKKRFGLIIGNDAYGPKVGALRNAVNDAKLVAKVLKTCGFELQGQDGVVANVDRDAMMEAVRKHAANLAAAGEDGMGFFYYAGHGAARSDGANYLIPVMDVDLTSLALWDKSVTLDWLVTDALGEVPCAQVVTIDACRNELKIPNRGVGGAGSFKSVRGMAVSGPTRMTNMFLSFATWEGQTAFDGSSTQSNGPYAVSLADNLVKPQVVIDVFDDVRIDVLERTSQAQEPMNLSRLARGSRDLTFTGEPAKTQPAPRPGPVGQPSTPVDVITGGLRGLRQSLNLALVMSCSYEGQGPSELRNAASDAKKVADALQGSGFEVYTSSNPKLPAMKEQIQAFADALKDRGPAAVGVLYFAGHGNSWNGHNYLMAQEHIPEFPGALEREGVPLEWIIRTLDASKARAVAFLIDGGRHVQQMIGKVPERGFAQDFGTNNVVVAFSTSPGQFATDTPTGSRFAAALADEIRKPERRYLQEMLGSVSRRIRVETQNEMIPSYLSSAKTPIYFRDGAGLDS